MITSKQQAYSEWLVVRSQSGDKTALELLLRLWANRYVLYARSRLRDNEAAKDVTQECLLAVSRGIGSLAEPAAFPKWSYRILERRCLDWISKSIRDREFIVASDEVPDVIMNDTTLQSITVAQLLQQLSADLAGIVRLYYLEGLSVAEIATITRLPKGTVKSRLFYTRKILAKSLENQYE